MKLLIVEDEVKLANALKRGFEQQNYVVSIALNGDDGLTEAESDEYDLIILDRMLPGSFDGISILIHIRSKGIVTPVIFLTAKDRVLDKAEGLNLGADDYLVKPFAFVELLARVRALVRRSSNTASNLLKYEDLEMDLTTTTVRRGDDDLQLSSREFALLEYFMTHQNQTISKDRLIEHVWGIDADVLPNTVEVYVGYLRSKIDKPHKKQLLHTRRGFGYVFGEAI